MKSTRKSPEILQIKIYLVLLLQIYQRTKGIIVTGPLTRRYESMYLSL